MSFRDREHAARLLAAALVGYRRSNPLVLGIPRGAVPMARIVAESLGGDLDVVLVRKIGAPGCAELAVGAVGENGDVSVSPHAADVGADAAYIEREAQAQRALLRERRWRVAAAGPPIDPAGRVVIVIDDGVATGATMLAALDLLRRRGPSKLVAATGVAAPRALDAIRAAADDVVCLEAPAWFQAVGQFFDDFAPVTDDEVVEILTDHRRRRAAGRRRNPGRAAVTEQVSIPVGTASVAGELTLPPSARGLVIFAHGSGSSRFSRRNRFVAARLRERRLGTLLLDLLTETEDAVYENRFDIDLLTERLTAVAVWAGDHPATEGLPVGFFGASTGAACALRAAADLGDAVGAVVSRGGRPDLALDALGRVRAPTLLVVGGADHGVVELNEAAYARLRCERRLEIVPGATHLFEEPGALESVADLAGAWFESRLAAPRHAATP